MKATPSFMLRRFRYIDDRGAYKEDDPTAPGGRKFDLIHPKTKKTIPLRKNRGWSFDQAEFERLVEEKRISFITESSIMVRRYLHETDSITPPSVYYQPARSASERLTRLMGNNIFEFPKDEKVIAKFIEMATEKNDNDCIVLDFFAGSGTTAHAVMEQNAEDGGQRQFILVQIPQPIDPKKQKEAHSFVKETLGKPEATIFEITAERLHRAGAKLEAELAAKAAEGGGLFDDNAPTLDTGFRVFELVDDPDALVLAQPLQDSTQADLLALQARIATPQPTQLPRVLHNLLFAEGLPLTTRITPVTTAEVPEGHLYRAADVLIVVKALAMDALTDAIRAQQAQPASAGPLNYLTVYAPWVQDDNFLLGIRSVADTLGFSQDKLRLRGVR